MASRGEMNRRYFYTVPVAEAQAMIVLMGFNVYDVMHPRRLRVFNSVGDVVLALKVFDQHVSRNSLVKLSTLAKKEGVL